MVLKGKTSKIKGAITLGMGKFYRAATSFLAQLLPEEAIRNTEVYRNREADVNLLEREKTALEIRLGQNVQSQAEKERIISDLGKQLTVTYEKMEKSEIKNNNYKRRVRRAIDLIRDLQIQKRGLEEKISEEISSRVSAIEEALQREWRSAIEDGTKMYDEMNKRRAEEIEEIRKELNEAEKQVRYARGALISRDNKIAKIVSGEAFLPLLSYLEQTNMRDAKAIYFNSEGRPIYATHPLLKLFGTTLNDLEKINLNAQQYNLDVQKSAIVVKVGKYEEGLKVHPIQFGEFGTLYIIDYKDRAFTRAVAHSRQELKNAFSYLVNALRYRRQIKDT